MMRDADIDVLSADGAQDTAIPNNTIDARIRHVNRDNAAAMDADHDADPYDRTLRAGMCRRCGVPTAWVDIAPDGTRTTVTPWMPGEAHPPARVDVDATDGEWCDHHNGHVPAGQTRPMEPRSRYRICNRCAAEAEAAWQSRRDAGLSETELRMEAGDR